MTGRSRGPTGMLPDSVTVGDVITIGRGRFWAPAGLVRRPVDERSSVNDRGPEGGSRTKRVVKQVDKQDSADDKKSPTKKLRLRELAAEASRHLDDILPGGDGLHMKEKPPQFGSEPASEDPASALSPGVKSREAPSLRVSRPAGVAGGSAVSAAGSEKAERGAVGTLETTRGSGRTPLRMAGEEAGRPSALVAHVSFGMARLLANILNQMGFHTSIATSPEEIDLHLDGRDWDLLFVQGTSTPYPGKKLASIVLSRCTGSRPYVVLISRRGDSLLPEAGRARAVGVIQWPFSPTTVSKTLAEILPITKRGRPERG